MLETIFGIKITHIVAGIAGGTVRALLMGGGWMAAFTSVVVGSLTAGYFTSPVYFFVVRWGPLPNEPSTEYAVSFLVGLTAMVGCEGSIAFVKAWIKHPTFPAGKT